MLPKKNEPLRRVVLSFNTKIIVVCLWQRLMAAWKIGAFEVYSADKELSLKLFILYYRN
jgi:hypothetical protein